MITTILRLYAKIFAKKYFVKLNTMLYSMSIRGLGIYNYENMEVSGESNFIKNHVLPRAKKKSKYIIFDIGANKGEYSELVAKPPNVEVHSFEPHPTTFEILKENTKSIDNIKYYNAAVSDNFGKLKLFDYASKDGSVHASLNSEIFTTVHKSSIVSHEVDVTTVDIVVEKNKFEMIDFLKIDVEGYELAVLNGSIKTLENKSISIVQFEFTQLNTTTRIFFKDFYELLSDNYSIYRLLPNGLLEIKQYDPTIQEIFGYQNYVAILKELE